MFSEELRKKIAKAGDYQNLEGRPKPPS